MPGSTKALVLLCRILGVVTHTDKRGAYVDVGGKMSAFIQTEDITLGPLQKVCHAASLCSGWT